MDDYNRQQRGRDKSRARERHMARKRRKETGFNIKNTSKMSDVPIPKGIPSVFTKIRFMLQDMIWLFFSRTPVFRMAGSVFIAVFLVFIGSYVLSGRIFPNIYAMDIALGDLTVEEAEAALQAEWENNVRIDLTIDGQVMLQAIPAELGLGIDIAETAIAAKNLGMSGIPFGATVAPVASVDYATAQTYLLNLTEQVYIPAYDAGYAWQEGELVATQGQAGKQLDISQSLERLSRDPVSVVSNRRFELLTTELLPKIVDASPYLDEAYAFLTSDVTLQGYDPFSDETISWEVDSNTASSWLATGTNGLTVREDVFVKHIQNLNKGLINSETPRYLDEQHSLENIREALRTSNPDVTLRVHYLPQPYEIEQGDNGFSIGRSNGIPFQMISEANPTIEWNQLSVGAQIQIPSRDALVSVDPILNKRIVVDLESQWLVAFENDEIVFSWGISSGRDTAPTYPGVFQILSHNKVAYGSSYALCNDAGTDCGEWEMSWFMGIYEVIPGLVNGFHGAVLLPNGAYLGGGGVSKPSTFGCLMSRDDNGKLLYDWSEVGTVVEILSKDYRPESELGQRALDFISTIDITYRPLPT
jgi:Putative peptidoglycan binding domain/L,D-transpeptidase catalytic domain